MLRDYKKESEERVAFIRELLIQAGADGIVYGNSGGKDSALVGILCKMACEDTLGVIMPCASKRNLNEDLCDGKEVADKFNIATKIFDLSDIKADILNLLQDEISISPMANANIAPRIRMITLYTIAASKNYLVAGTGNRSEGYMGYFTKWGDGAYDFNPIADLTVTEIYEFLEFLESPKCIMEKAPSAGLYDGQTDEIEMGITYQKIDEFLLNGTVSLEDKAIIDRYHNVSEHKRQMPVNYNN